MLAAWPCPLGDDGAMPELNYGRFEALTFDCYGTLIDWETGILAGLRRVVGGGAGGPADDELLERYAAFEADAEAGPYRRYRDILADGLKAVARAYGVDADDAEAA